MSLIKIEHSELRRIIFEHLGELDTAADPYRATDVTSDIMEEVVFKQLDARKSVDL